MKSKKNAGRILSIALLLAVLFGAIFCSKTPKNNQFPYIPQDYYPVKIEYIDAPDEIPGISLKRMNSLLKTGYFVSHLAMYFLKRFLQELLKEKNALLR